MLDTNFWVIMTTAGQFRVNEQTVVDIRAEVARYAGKAHQENVELSFTDIANSQCYVVLASYLGILESTPEQRAYDRRLNKALDKEKEEDDPSWQ